MGQSESDGRRGAGKGWSIIGEGYHTRYGQLHAEREAFKNAAERGEETAGADLYVTLELLSHRKTAAVYGAVLASGVKRVIVGCTDPNPVVAGRGIRLLREKAGSGGRSFTRGV